MQITLKLWPKIGADAVAAVRETIAAVNPDLASSAEVSEVFPGVTSGNRAGMMIVRLTSDSESDAHAVLEALKARPDVVFAEPAQRRKAR